MASFEITGTLKLKQETQVVSDKFSKREFVITTDMTTPYPQYINLQLTQDKCNLLDSVNLGDEIKVSFNLRGREWNGPQGVKYFNSLEAWRIEKMSTQSSTPLEYNQVLHAQSTPNLEIATKPEVDDLPF